MLLPDFDLAVQNYLINITTKRILTFVRIRFEFSALIS